MIIFSHFLTIWIIMANWMCFPPFEFGWRNMSLPTFSKNGGKSPIHDSVPLPPIVFLHVSPLRWYQNTLISFKCAFSHEISTTSLQNGIKTLFTLGIKIGFCRQDMCKFLDSQSRIRSVSKR